MNLFKNLFSSKTAEPVLDYKKAIVFVDYEHWYYSCRNLFHIAPDPITWRKSLDEKYNIINNFRSMIKTENVWDFGSNTGIFSRIFSDNGANVIAFDIDKMAIEKNYLKIKQDKEQNIFPLVFDLANPSPSLGWANKERKNLMERAKDVDLILALALIHHLRFTYNIPFENIAKYFSSISKYLIIEFVDKKDSKVQKMLLNRKDVFDDYTQANFENEFCEYYKILCKEKISKTERTLYLMETK